MDVLRFVKWWWNRLSIDEKISLLFLFYTGLGIIPACILGVFNAFVIWAVGLVSMFFLYLLYLFCLEVKKRWDQFQKEREDEAKRIMQKLRNG